VSSDHVDKLVARIRLGDRHASAEFMARYGPLIRRRIGGKLGGKLRRLFDSQELLSTVGRRLDRYVLAGRVRAESAGQMFNLIFRMADAAMIDKSRVMKRLNRAEGEDSPFTRAFLNRIEEAERRAPDGAESQIDAAFRSLPDPIDREILALWLQGKHHSVIAVHIGLSPAAVRKRWQMIRERLQTRLEGAA
jgi:DNA-directed RNA polymerase specialized sigma24 family protein